MALRGQGWSQWSATAGLMRLSMVACLTSFGDGQEYVANGSPAATAEENKLNRKGETEAQLRGQRMKRMISRMDGEFDCNAPTIPWHGIPHDVQGGGRRPSATGHW